MHTWTRRLGTPFLLLVIVIVAAIALLIYHDQGHSPTGTRLIAAAANAPLDVAYGQTPSISAPGLSSETLCRDTLTSCRAYALSLINAARRAIGTPVLRLDWTLSKGIGCVGPVGHAKAMALDNNASQPIWHISPDPQYDYASFNRDMEPCVGLVAQGQNIGLSYGEGIQASMLTIHMQMMAEPHDPAYCATFVNHACNILSRTYTRVGIGFDAINGKVYVVWDFAA